MAVRYTFLLIVSQCDDYGLLEAQPRQLMGKLFPHDQELVDADVLGWVEQLVQAGRIRWRVTDDGSPVLEVVNWAKHQMVKNPGKPILRDKLRPADETPNPILPQVSIEPKANRGQIDGDLGGADRERDLGEGEVKGPLSRKSATPKTTTVKKPSWVAEAVELWAEAIGVVSHGRMGKALKPVVDRWPWDTGDPKGQHVKRWLRVYLDARPYTRRDGSVWGDLPTDTDANAPPRDTRFCTPDDFAQNIQQWRNRCLPLKDRGAA